MGKLHELLAVEPDLKAHAQSVLAQAKSLFAEAKGRFTGHVKSYRPLDEGGEPFANEVMALSTTVPVQLSEVAKTVGAWIDLAIQKESTNQQTQADVVVEGVTLFHDLPATALLNLESKLAELRQLYAAVPTNDPAEQWVWQEDLGHFIARPKDTYRTKKTMQRFVKYEATKEHPAQVEIYTEDVRVGTWTTTGTSGMLTPVDKQARLERLDKLIQAVKAARQRANDVEVVKVHVAKDLFAYVNGS